MKLGFAIKKTKKTGLIPPTASNTGTGNNGNSIGNAFVAAAPAKQEAVKVFVTDFDANAIGPATEAERKKKELVIPLIAKNEWNQDKQDNEAEKPAETQTALTADEIAAQELLQDVRKSQDEVNGTAKQRKASTLVIPMAQDEEKAKAKAELFKTNDQESAKGTIAVPILRQNVVPGMDALQDVTEKYRHDVALRPEAPDVHSDAYESVPVEEFGVALLRGMGWKGTIEDDKDTEEIKPRHKLLGLGATVRPPLPSDKHDKRKHKKQLAIEDKSRNVGLNQVKNQRADRERSDNRRDRSRSRRTERDDRSRSRDRDSRRRREEKEDKEDRRRHRHRDRDRDRDRNRDCSSERKPRSDRRSSRSRSRDRKRERSSSDRRRR